MPEPGETGEVIDIAVPAERGRIRTVVQHNVRTGEEQVVWERLAVCENVPCLRVQVIDETGQAVRTCELDLNAEESEAIWRQAAAAYRANAERKRQMSGAA